jgi:hypothetical protein
MKLIQAVARPAFFATRLLLREHLREIPSAAKLKGSEIPSPRISIIASSWPTYIPGVVGDILLFQYLFTVIIIFADRVGRS